MLSNPPPSRGAARYAVLAALLSACAVTIGWAANLSRDDKGGGAGRGQDGPLPSAHGPDAGGPNTPAAAFDVHGLKNAATFAGPGTAPQDRLGSHAANPDSAAGGCGAGALARGTPCFAEQAEQHGDGPFHSSFSGAASGFAAPYGPANLAVPGSDSMPRSALTDSVPIGLETAPRAGTIPAPQAPAPPPSPAPPSASPTPAAPSTPATPPAPATPLEPATPATPAPPAPPVSPAPPYVPAPPALPVPPLVPVAPVPEPETWLMMSSGLACVGLMARRRAAARR